MYLTEFTALALGIAAVNAFQDTSPFIFFSTSKILASSPEIVTAPALSKTILVELEKCPSNLYVLVSQPGVGASDYIGRHSMPHLQNYVTGKDKHIRSSLTVKHVIGEIDPKVLAETLGSRCGARSFSVDASTGLFEIVDDINPRIIHVDFSPLPTDTTRPQASRVNDLFLSNLLTTLPSLNYTVIYTTTPLADAHVLVSEQGSYQMDDLSAFHMDLKRDNSINGQAAGSNSTGGSEPLFEKYQFFTPALFIGLLVGSVLLLILYYAISGLASLEVSYAAFDRENGPAAQKKQQ